MKIFEKKMLLYDVICINNQLLPIFNRFDIYLGFGNNTIEDICREKNIDINFFLQIINIYHNETYFPEHQTLKFDFSLIINYLKHTHQYYLKFVLPEFDKQLQMIKDSNKEKDSDFDLLSKFYKKYVQELLIHIKDEEKNIFPYVLAIQKVADKKLNKDEFTKTFGNRSMVDFDKEHSNMEIKMNDLKALILKYLQPVYNQNFCNTFLFSLIRFEKDLKDHARIEDKILIPKVKELEKNILF